MEIVSYLEGVATGVLGLFVLLWMLGSFSFRLTIEDGKIKTKTKREPYQ